MTKVATESRKIILVTLKLCGCHPCVPPLSTNMNETFGTDLELQDSRYVVSLYSNFESLPVS